METKPIKGEADYERALRRVEELWDASQGSAESDELDILTTLIETYEREHYPIDPPDSIEAIERATFPLDASWNFSQPCVRTWKSLCARPIRNCALSVVSV